MSGDSMRDRLSDFAEALVAALTGDSPAEIRFRRAGPDLLAGGEDRGHYIANPKDRWPNEYDVDSRGETARSTPLSSSWIWK